MRWAVRLLTLNGHFIRECIPVRYHSGVAVVKSEWISSIVLVGSPVGTVTKKL
jgi:hypothetical protein